MNGHQLVVPECRTDQLGNMHSQRRANPVERGVRRRKSLFETQDGVFVDSRAVGQITDRQILAQSEPLNSGTKRRRIGTCVQRPPRRAQ